MNVIFVFKTILKKQLYQHARVWKREGSVS
jgi:hypothetical protein